MGLLGCLRSARSQSERNYRIWNTRYEAAGRLPDISLYHYVSSPPHGYL